MYLSHMDSYKSFSYLFLLSVFLFTFVQYDSTRQY